MNKPRGISMLKEWTYSIVQKGQLKQKRQKGQITCVCMIEPKHVIIACWISVQAESMCKLFISPDTKERWSRGTLRGNEIKRTENVTANLEDTEQDLQALNLMELDTNTV